MGKIEYGACGSCQILMVESRHSSFAPPSVIVPVGATASVNVDSPPGYRTAYSSSCIIGRLTPVRACKQEIKRKERGGVRATRLVKHTHNTDPRPINRRTAQQQTISEPALLCGESCSDSSQNDRIVHVLSWGMANSPSGREDTGPVLREVITPTTRDDMYRAQNGECN